jgi:GNAT superfamily N-acetyltransferase
MSVMAVPSVRPAEPSDREFLRRVYASTRADELALTGWSAEACADFVAMQFDAQEAHYRQHFPLADLGVIEVRAEGAELPVGRLWVDRRVASVHVLDIALLDGVRGQGLGTACLRQLMGEAAARAVPLTIKVERFNPARRLYDRLGFVVEDGEHGMHVQMAWRAGAAVATEEHENEEA